MAENKKMLDGLKREKTDDEAKRQKIADEELKKKLKFYLKKQIQNRIEILDLY